MLHGRHGGGVAVHEPPPKGVQVTKSRELLYVSLVLVLVLLLAVESAQGAL